MKHLSKIHLRALRYVPKREGRKERLAQVPYSKAKYYRDWYEKMTPEEKRSEVGLWVKENLERYASILTAA